MAKIPVMSPNLNDSMKRYAVKLGMSFEDLSQHEINRIEEMRLKTLPKTERKAEMKRNRIATNQPILIVGAGPSYEENLDEIRKFKGKIMCVDVNFNNLGKNGIFPDYIATLEVYVRPDFFNLDLLSNKPLFICSSITNDSVIRKAEAAECPFIRWITHDEPRASNVGIFAVLFAKEYLKCDKICIIGFEHDGQGYQEDVYKYWQYDFWYFLQRWPKETIVNCSNGGALYYEDYIIDAELKDLVIEDILKEEDFASSEHDEAYKKISCKHSTMKQILKNQEEAEKYRTYIQNWLDEINTRIIIDKLKKRFAELKSGKEDIYSRTGLQELQEILEEE